jgi:hypothetical protein
MAEQTREDLFFFMLVHEQQAAVLEPHLRERFEPDLVNLVMAEGLVTRVDGDVLRFTPADGWWRRLALDLARAFSGEAQHRLLDVSREAVRRL